MNYNQKYHAHFFFLWACFTVYCFWEKKYPDLTSCDFFFLLLLLLFLFCQMHVRAYFSCLFFVPHLRQTTFYSPPLAKIESLRENLWGLQSPRHTLLILCQKQRLCFVHAILAFNLFCWRLHPNKYSLVVKSTNRCTGDLL